MKIGDKLTQKEFDEFKKQYKAYNFGYTWFEFNKDLRFERLEERDGTVMWELVSTMESRIKSQDTGHANIHRPEQRNYKRYYEGKS